MFPKNCCIIRGRGTHKLQPPALGPRSHTHSRADFRAHPFRVETGPTQSWIGDEVTAHSRRHGLKQGRHLHGHKQDAGNAEDQAPYGLPGMRRTRCRTACREWGGPSAVRLAGNGEDQAPYGLPGKGRTRCRGVCREM
ncbi:hypothetical protein chiPu_0024465 [Chiloscyllium punctatum]|uniref:Uncharacterized protein n=1 Tax=Chiloscyllium punctatum TaxID=137246 RepID=A0A401TDC2_CHIPU|nr:hypothetical protein [Chiloscyllium punctatum]